MKFISGLFVVFSALFPTVTFGQICSNADTIVDPEQFDWGQKIGIGSPISRLRSSGTTNP